MSTPIDLHTLRSLTLLCFLCQSLIEAHDKVAAKAYEMPQAPANSRASLSGSLVPPDAVRMIGIQKKAGEPLVSPLKPFVQREPQLCSTFTVHPGLIKLKGFMHILCIAEPCLTGRYEK